MKEIELIRRYFKPIQPSVKMGGSVINYQEFKPSKLLENYIYCYWELKTNKVLNEPFNYRVVSDGCIDIFFDLNAPNNNFVMGFCRKFTEFNIGKSFNYFGIRFLPSIFPLLFNFDAKKLSNRYQDLNNVIPIFSKWISDIKPENNLPEIFNVKFESILRIQDQIFDDRFFNAMIKILVKHGNLDVEKELMTGLSPRQLRRKFNYHLGTSPKAFANVVRFQYILNAKPSKQSLKENKIYLDVGFFDQAHFIKCFKIFYGVTPSLAFGRI